MAKVIWSPVAVADLEAIADYIAKDSPDRASLFCDRIIEVAERLASFPQAGTAIPEIGSRTSRQLVVGSYRLLYELEQDRVVVAAVVHGARQWPPTS
jgi:toxin ParE1/3/4